VAGDDRQNRLRPQLNLGTSRVCGHDAKTADLPPSAHTEGGERTLDAGDQAMSPTKTAMRRSCVRAILGRPSASGPVVPAGRMRAFVMCSVWRA